MDNHILFSESQKFKQWWVWVILGSINFLFIFGIYKQVMNGEQFGNKPMSDTGLVITAVTTMVLTIAIINFRLDTIIKQDGIYVRFFPIHLKFKHYKWDRLSKLFVRQYSPIKEYGGWGVRLSLFGHGTAYNITGDKGLQLIFLDKKKLLIGTDKPDELTETLNKIGQIKL